MDRLIYKEADGDLTCRSRDFDKVFPTLYAYEESGLTPDEVKALGANLDAMTGMSVELTNKLDQARKELEALKAELVDERHRHDRYVDFELAESEELRKVKTDLDAAMADIQRCCATCALCSRNNGTGEMCPWSFDCNQVDGDHWEWRGAKDNNVPGKKEG